jgi:type II secretory pathway component PulK
MKKTINAGALLFAIITVFVLCMVASTLVVLTTNQYRIIDSEIDRIKASYLAQAGTELAIYNLYQNTVGWKPGDAGYTNPRPVTINGKTVNIRITTPGTYSTYNIQAQVDY